MSQNVTAAVTLDNSRKEFEFADPFTQVYKDKGCPQGKFFFNQNIGISFIT